MTPKRSLPRRTFLKGAGVDITSPEPVDQAMQVFGERVEEMEKLLGA